MKTNIFLFLIGLMTVIISTPLYSFEEVNLDLNFDINSKEDLCRAIKTQSFFQKKLLYDNESRLAFLNLPGPIGHGVCWWHSRFTRAANYLIIFRPDIKHKPEPHEVKEILRHISKRDSVVEITGYRNLKEFSDDQKSLIEKELNHWIFKDILNFKLKNGIEGKSEEDPKKLEQAMDQLYFLVHDEGRVVFQILQLPNIPVHSWLVVGIKKIANGYELKVVDSNYADIQTWTYIRGQSHFSYSYDGELSLSGHFVPYTTKIWKIEEDEIKQVIQNYCL